METQEESIARWRRHDRIIDKLFELGFRSTYEIAVIEIQDVVSKVAGDYPDQANPKLFEGIVLDSVKHVVQEIAMEACLILMGVKEYNIEAWEKLDGVQRAEVSGK